MTLFFSFSAIMGFLCWDKTCLNGLRNSWQHRTANCHQKPAIPIVHCQCSGEQNRYLTHNTLHVLSVFPEFTGCSKLTASKYGFWNLFACLPDSRTFFLSSWILDLDSIHCQAQINPIQLSKLTVSSSCPLSFVQALFSSSHHPSFPPHPY